MTHTWFFGNSQYDRIPQGCPGDCVTEDIARTDYGLHGPFRALSPYWDGKILCEVPEGCDFSVEPPIVQPGFAVLGYEEEGKYYPCLPTQKEEEWIPPHLEGETP